MTAICLLLLLPTLVYSKIDIELSGRFDNGNSNLKVDYFGNEVGIISDLERDTYKFSDKNLKDAVKTYFGKRPDDAFLRSPTPWGDLYKTYGWKQVVRKLIPKSGDVLQVSSKPEVVVEQLLKNNGDKPAQFNIALTHQATNNVSSTFSKDGELSVVQENEYDFEIDVAKDVKKTYFKYTALWGQNYEKSDTITVGTTSAVEITLKPGQEVIAKLVSTRGLIKMGMEYAADLSGVTAVNYATPYNGHHFWGLDVKAVMSSGKLIHNIESKEVINIDFYAYTDLVVVDKATNEILLSIIC